MDADVIVVGAGPAGSWLAYNLARKGVKVLILEKESWPRYKACGGAVSRKTLNILKKGNITLPEYVIKNVVDNFVFRFDFQKSFSYHYKNEGISLVKREKFDDSLLNYACREGAIFRSRQEVNEIEILENKVKVKAGNKLYQGKIIVGADGANSKISYLLNLTPDNIIENKGSAIELELDKKDIKNNSLNNNEIIIDFGLIPDGYGWVFPKDNRISIGMGSLDSMGKINLRKKVDEYLDYLNIDIDKSNLSYKGHPLPFYGEISRGIDVSGNRYLLIGDAAHMLDPLVGEGIYYACLSAEIAAETILNQLRKNNYDLTLYNKKIKQIINPKLKSAEKLGQIFYNNTDYFKKMISIKKKILTTFLDVIQDKSSFSNLFSLI